MPSLLGDDEQRVGLLGIPERDLIDVAQQYNTMRQASRAAGVRDKQSQRWGQHLPGVGTMLPPNFRTTDPNRLTVDPMELHYDYGEGRTTLPPQNWIGPEREA